MAYHPRFVLFVFGDEPKDWSALPTLREGSATAQVTTSVIDSRVQEQHTRLVLILLVSPNEERLNRLRAAVHSAGFRTISARHLDDAWTRTDFFDFGAVVIDYELKSEIAASAFRQRFLTLNLNENDAPEIVVMELASVLNRGSELVH